MAISCTNCTIPAFDLNAQCGIITEPGGINCVAFVQCTDSTVYADPTDPTVWATAIAGGTAVVIKNILGMLGDPNDSAKRLTSCTPEQLQGRVWSMDFEDSSFTKEVSPALIEQKTLLYNDLMKNPAQYYCYYGECQGYMYLVEDFAFFSSMFTPNNNQELKYYKNAVKFQQIEIPTPIDFNLNSL
jgi:hypothetical protein